MIGSYVREPQSPHLQAGDGNSIVLLHTTDKIWNTILQSSMQCCEQVVHNGDKYSYSRKVQNTNSAKEMELEIGMSPSSSPTPFMSLSKSLNVSVGLK